MALWEKQFEQLKQQEQAAIKSKQPKPVRAALGSILTSPVTGLASLVGLGSAAVQYPFNDKGYLETYADTLGYKTAENVQRFVTKDVFGGSDPSNFTHAESNVALLGDLIPTIATGGTYGAIKIPTKVTAKSIGATKKQITKETNKILDKAKEQGIDKTVQEARTEAKIKLRDPLTTKRLLRDVTIPGVQITRRKQLVKDYMVDAYNRGDIKDTLDYNRILKDANKAATRTQLSEAALGIGSPVALSETIGALTDTYGVFGDYTDTEIEDLNAQREESEGIGLATGIGVALGTVAGYQVLKRVTAKNIDNVKQQLDDIAIYEQADKAVTKNKDIRQTPKAIVSDIRDNLNLPEFNHIVQPDKKNPLDVREVMSTNINAQTDNAFEWGTSAMLPTRITASGKRLLKDLTDFKNNDYKAYRQLEDFIEAHNQLSNAINTIATSYKRFNYKALKTGITDKDLQRYGEKRPDMPVRVKQLRQQVEELLPKVRANQISNDLLDRISRFEKGILDNAYKSGIYNKDVYDYLVNNHTIKGIYIYKPNTPIGSTTKRSLKDRLLSDTEDYRTRTNTEYRTGYFGRAEDFLTTFQSQAIGDIKEIIINELKRKTLNIMFGRDRSNIAKWGNDKARGFKIFKQPTNRALTPQEERARLAIHNHNEALRTEAQDLERIDLLGSMNAKGEFTPYIYNINSSKSPWINYYNQAKNADSERADVFKRIRNADFRNDIVSVKHDGKEYFYKVHPYIGAVYNFSPTAANSLQELAIQARRVVQSTSTGNLNPTFAITSLFYGLGETLTALPRMIKELGSDFNIFKDTYGYIKSVGSVIRMRVVDQWTDNMIETARKELLNNTLTPQERDLKRKQLAVLQKKLKSSFLTKIKSYGTTTAHYTNDAGENFYQLNLTSGIEDNIRQGLSKVFGTRTKNILNMLGAILEGTRNASNDAAMLYLSGRQKLESSDDFLKLNKIITNFLTDSTKHGNYSGIAGNLIGGIANYVPYGNTMIQSLVAKGNASGIFNIPSFVKHSAKLINQSESRVIDTLTILRLGADNLKNNSYVRGLILTSALPTIISYLWNHSNQDQRNTYYTLSDYDKASKLVFANMLGKGNHLTIPVDQELAVVNKVLEAMLDSVFSGSSMQGIDPRFENQRLLMVAAQRSFGIENLVFPELLLNISGYQSGQLASGGNFISKLPPNQTNLDGSQSAIKNGIFTQESKAMIGTLFGVLGNALVSGIEQGNIGLRDVGVGQGLQDFLTGVTRPLTKNLPLYSNRLIYRTTNQTKEDNDNKDIGIDYLRKLISHVDSKLSSKFGQRKSLDVQNYAQLERLNPKQLRDYKVAQVAVPLYNQYIKPIDDEISAIYKQVAAYNATGRDRNGKIVTQENRLAFQQAMNLRIQQRHAIKQKLYRKLEDILTNNFGYAIRFDSFVK